MKSILHQLYDGEVYPSENIRCKDPEYTQIRNSISEEREHFLRMCQQSKQAI